MNVLDQVALYVGSAGVLITTTVLATKRVLSAMEERAKGKHRESSKQDTSSPPSPPTYRQPAMVPPAPGAPSGPAAASDREMMRRAARAAGFDAGNTGRFEALHSLGGMRCDGHGAVVQMQDTILQELRDGRQETNEKLDALSGQIGTMGIGLARTETRLDAQEKEIDRLRNERTGRHGPRV